MGACVVSIAVPMPGSGRPSFCQVYHEKNTFCLPTLLMASLVVSSFFDNIGEGSDCGSGIAPNHPESHKISLRVYMTLLGSGGSLRRPIVRRTAALHAGF